MAFPTVADADTKNGTVTTNASSWTLTYPTNIASGDLLLALIGMDGNGTGAGVPSTWNAMYYDNDGGGNTTLLVAVKIAAGTETGTFSWALGASEQGGWRVFRISGWYGSDLPATGAMSAAGVNPAGAGFEIKRATTGSPSANPDPPSLDPANWATEDTLWLAVAAVDTSRTFSVFPTNYTNTFSDVSGGAGGASLGGARRANAASSEDPSAFTVSASDDWVAATIAIRPAAGGAPPFSPIDPMGATGFFGL